MEYLLALVFLCIALFSNPDRECEEVVRDVNITYCAKWKDADASNHK